MTTRPKDLPEWATDPAADIVEPTLGKKIIGWLTDEEPPAQFFNWWKNKVFQWLEYTEDVTLLSPLEWGNDIGSRVVRMTSGEFVASGFPVGLKCWVGVGEHNGASPQIVVHTFGPTRYFSPSSAGTVNARDVAYDTFNRQWVVVGDAGSIGADALILRSVDLDDVAVGSWSERVNPKDFVLRAIAQNDAGVLVAAGDNDGSDAYCVRSVDGTATTWAEVVLGGATTAIKDMLWNGTNFVAVGNEGFGNPVIYTSPDGLAPWTSRTIDGAATGDLNEVAYNGVATIAVGDDGEIHRSTDFGVTWTLVRNPGSSPEDNDIDSVAGHPGNGPFLAGAIDGLMLISLDDGLTWDFFPLTFDFTQGSSNTTKIGADAGGFAIASRGAASTDFMGFTHMVK